MDNNNLMPLECFYRWEQETPDKVYLRQAQKLQWREYTWREVGDRVRRLASYIREQSYPQGSSICIFAANCADWFVVDLAIMLSGHVSVPLYPGQDLGSAKYILEHSETRLMFLGAFDQAAEAKAQLPKGITTVSIHGCTLDCDEQLESVIANHEPFAESPRPDPEAVFTMLYTSGTTGNPKGVMHQHKTPASVVPRMKEGFRRGRREERFFSFLPLAHAAERIVVEMMSLYVNPTVSFSEGLETFPEEMRSVQPTMFFAVPRLWVKFKAALEAKIPAEVMANFGEAEKAAVRQQLGLAEADFVLTGSAPAPRDVQQWFIDLGVIIRDGYGMTENFIDGCMWMKDDSPIPGCVGQSVGGSEVKLSEEGEILFRSPGLMLGYYKNPEKTAEVIVDGWYHSGDSGRFDEDGNLWVTGRISEVFKTSKGKFVRPSHLEAVFADLSLMEQLCVFGHGEDKPMMLAKRTVQAEGKTEAEIAAITADELAEINAGLPAYEKLGQIFVVEDEWSIDSGLLTPTLKVKRNAVNQHYEKGIAAAKGAAAVSFI